MPATTKRHLRNFYRAARRAVPLESQHRHAIAIATEVLARLPDDATMAAYLARDGEVDLKTVIERCWERGIAVAVPVLREGDMAFAAYRQDEPMRLNRFGIPEPARPEFLTPSIVLAPLVAFDDQGRRLGMGGGYYDRYFAATATPMRVGIAHECQRAPALPAKPWDVPLTDVVTENGWQAF